jgi:hypothetical protein
LRKGEEKQNRQEGDRKLKRMPGMPDSMTSFQNGMKNGVHMKEPSKARVDVKAIEKGVLSSTEHLNEIITLNDLVSVYTLSSVFNK